MTNPHADQGDGVARLTEELEPSEFVGTRRVYEASKVHAVLARLAASLVEQEQELAEVDGFLWTPKDLNLGADRRMAYRRGWLKSASEAADRHETERDALIERAEAAEASLAAQAQQSGQLRLERDSAREQFDKHIEWASDQLAALTRERDAMQAAMAGGVGLIAAERQRQVSQEGWTPEHDDTHTDGSLATAAAVLACEDAEVPGYFGSWIEALVKKHYGNRMRELVIAGALIAAEIDRVRRAAPPVLASADPEAR